MSIEPGAIVGNVFRIISVIGEGGMGTVYHAENSTRTEQTLRQSLPKLKSIE